ncbi:DinB family protein [Sutcliffiella deserti]|uniref:DinB family protein n=1 Tax=Sutcliffiella deserti TaxID=2875501 RepID=UPI001CBE1635|nr:DinB family protein [Sutcliffiella deserti]
MTSEALLFKQLSFVRNRTNLILETTSEELADRMPNGFRNSIRWNAGHIFLTMDTLLYSFAGKEHYVPLSYFKLFQMNTSPAGWGSEPPNMDEIKGHLLDQTDRIKKDFTGRLDEKIVKPFQIGDYKLDTLAEVLGFANWHEGLHQGVMNSIKRASGINDLWGK